MSERAKIGYDLPQHDIKASRRKDKRAAAAHDESCPSLFLSPFPLLFSPTSRNRRDTADAAHSDRHRVLRARNRREVLERALYPCAPDLGHVLVEDDPELLVEDEEVGDVGGADDAVEDLFDDEEDVVERGRDVWKRGEVGLVHEMGLQNQVKDCRQRQACGMHMASSTHPFNRTSQVPNLERKVRLVELPGDRLAKRALLGDGQLRLLRICTFVSVRLSSRRRRRLFALFRERKGRQCEDTEEVAKSRAEEPEGETHL